MKMSTVETWLGPFTVLVDEDGAVLASGWTGDASVLVPLIHRRLRGAGDPVWRRDLGGVTRAVLDYHEGDLRATQACDVRQHSDGQFLATAWKALREVEPGSPISYAQLADRTGSPTASRAAAQACARNAAALFVPCHRIVRTDGSLGGFRWSIQTKQRLLAHESGAAATRT